MDPYSGMIQFDATSAVPEPTYTALAGGMMLLGPLIARAKVHRIRACQTAGASSGK